MKKVFLIHILIFSILVINHCFAKNLHFPEDRDYVTKRDTGYNQYAAPSLHYTNQYVLTFDDGPHPRITPKVLDILKKHGVKATFFINTVNLNDKTFPIFKRILDEGHIAASHGHKHLNHNHVSESDFKSNIKRSLEILQSYHLKAGHEMNHSFFRFPYAAYGHNSKYHHMNTMKEVSQELYGKNCIQFVFWDIDSGDWIPGITPSELLQNVKVAQMGGQYTSYKVSNRKIYKREKIFVNPFNPTMPTTEGGVILFHDIQNSTKLGLDGVLNYLKQNNLSVTTLDQVEEFSYSGSSCF